MKPSKNFLIGLLLGIVIAGIAVFLWMNGRMKHQGYIDQKQITQQAEVIENYTKNGYEPLVANVLALLDNELKDNPKRILSDESINRVTTLCSALKPYARPEGDSTSTKKLSPERGYMLLVLSGMKLDTGSMQRIKATTSFAYADLREADLSGTDLSSIDLSGADLYGANLHETNLDGADLSEANLWAANLRQASLDGANLKRADLKWANLNDATLQKADITEAEMASAQLRNADLKGAIMRWTDLTGAFLNEANLDSADMFRTGLRRAQLGGTILTDANLNLANLTEANMSGANLTSALLTDVIVLDSLWITQLKEWNVTGAEDIQSNYKMLEDRSEKPTRYLLKKN